MRKLLIAALVLIPVALFAGWVNRVSDNDTFGIGQKGALDLAKYSATIYHVGNMDVENCYYLTKDTLPKGYAVKLDAFGDTVVTKAHLGTGARAAIAIADSVHYATEWLQAAHGGAYQGVNLMTYWFAAGLDSLFIKGRNEAGKAVSETMTVNALQGWKPFTKTYSRVDSVWIAAYTSHDSLGIFCSNPMLLNVRETPATADTAMFGVLAETAYGRGIVKVAVGRYCQAMVYADSTTGHLFPGAPLITTSGVAGKLIATNITNGVNYCMGWAAEPAVSTGLRWIYLKRR